MKHRALKTPALFLILAALLLTPRNVLSCGPMFPELLFTDSQRPESFDRFAAGNLGVVQPTYPRSILFAAYRILENKPLAADEQKVLVSLWKHRWADFGVAPNSSVQRWLTVRTRVPGVNPLENIPTYTFLGNFANVLSCTDDAFNNAIVTLDQRIQRFGASNPQVVAWVHAQDQVFDNCYERKHAIPEAAPASFDPLLRADRAYQIAAAHFYDQNWGAAISGFNQIASDTKSPWHVIAPYLAARALVRESTLSKAEGFDHEPMEKAELAVKAILADKSRTAIHPAATRLLHFIEFRLHPEQRLAELGRQLQSDAPLAVEDVEDYALLLDKQTEHVGEAKQADALRPKLAPDKSPDITDWLMAFQSSDEKSREHAVGRFQQTHSPAWLVAAISKTVPADPNAQQLIDAALALKPSSPAYVTAMYHAMRILSVTHPDQARARIDSLFAQSAKPLDNASRNLFYALRFRLARNLTELVAFAQRTPSGVDPGDGSWDTTIPTNEKDPHTSVAWDVDAMRTFDTAIPVAQLAAAVQVKSLAPVLRNELAVATWTRAALLDDPQIANAVVPAATAAIPSLNAANDDYQAATTRDARRFSVVFALLHLPGARPWVTSGFGRMETATRIDNLRDNWWCSASRPDAGAYAYESPSRSVLPPGTDAPVLTHSQSVWATASTQTPPAAKPPATSPAFLSTADVARTASERTALEELGPAPNFFADETLKWAKAHPDDPRVPEALHLAVRSTRYGCADQSTTHWSKQAFDLLHRRYPKSEWTKKTKYYY